MPPGKTLDNDRPSAYLVPTYVVEQNPGIKSVFDIRDYIDLFATRRSEGKALLVHWVSDWAPRLTSNR